jgi:hypothetical protein
MRPDLDARRRITFSDVREQKQHQQCPIARSDIGPPRRIIMTLIRVAGRAGKADIDVPTGVAGIVRMRKPHRKGAKVGTRTPTAFSDELVEGRVENRTVHRAFERLAAIVTKPDHRPRPRRRVVRIAWQIAPHDLAALVGEFTGKGPVEPDKSVLNELLYLRAAECARGFAFMGRHEKSSYRLPATIAPLRAQGRLGSFGPKECFRPPWPSAH